MEIPRLLAIFFLMLADQNPMIQIGRLLNGLLKFHMLVVLQKKPSSRQQLDIA